MLLITTLAQIDFLASSSISSKIFINFPKPKISIGFVDTGVIISLLTLIATRLISASNPPQSIQRNSIPSS